jgi:predicted DNA-binding transcriptional regulator YafY
MPKSENQKMKMFYLVDYLKRNTDMDHTVSMKEILEYLDSNGISAERKSIYNDIELLNNYGYDINFKKERPSGYYIGSREFELAELKLLVDAVQSSKFITERKSNSLISKLEKMSSKYEAHNLQRQVYVTNRVKADNEAILYNIDFIHEAIGDNKKIIFKYCEWNTDKKLVYRNHGEDYIVSPVTLLWDDENYYLVAYDDENERIKHFRVDKIRDIRVSDMKRDRNDLINEIKPDAYSKQHFGMFSGDVETVTLCFEKSAVGIVIDRFGKEIDIIPRNGECCATRVKVNVSNTFFGWIATSRGRIRIEGPETVRQQFISFIDDIRQGV